MVIYIFNFITENILMTGGAGGALNVALKSILDPGDEVIYFTPFFPEYYFLSKKLGRLNYRETGNMAVWILINYLIQFLRKTVRMTF